MIQQDLVPAILHFFGNRAVENWQPAWVTAFADWIR
jgi:hypothetical protein